MHVLEGGCMEQQGEGMFAGMSTSLNIVVASGESPGGGGADNKGQTPYGASEPRMSYLHQHKNNVNQQPCMPSSPLGPVHSSQGPGDSSCRTPLVRAVSAWGGGTEPAQEGEEATATLSAPWGSPQACGRQN